MRITVWSDPYLSLTKITRLIRDQLAQLIPIATHRPSLIELLTRWKTRFHALARIDKRRRKPSSPQLLANPDLLTYNG